MILIYKEKSYCVYISRIDRDSARKLVCGNNAYRDEMSEGGFCMTGTYLHNRGTDIKKAQEKKFDEEEMRMLEC